MNKSLIRVVLCSTATYLVPAIPAALLLPTTAAAQVTCSQTGPAITCLDGATTVATGTTDGTVTAGPGLVINSAGNQTTTLTATGPVATNAASTNAIDLTSGGTLDFTQTGTVSTTGASSIGIDASSTTGAITVNTGIVSSTGTGSPAAVRAVASGIAPVIVNATGNVTSGTGAGILVSTLGAATVTTNSGTTVQGATAGIDVTSGTTTALNVNGIVQGTGTGQAIIATGGPATVTIGSTGRVNGRSTLTVGDDVVNNSGTYNAIGTTDFGAGTDVFNNLATGTVFSTNGAAVFAGLETFNNTAGLIDMRDGAANDTLNLSGNYVGSGNARLGLDIDGTASGGLTSDRLIIGGNASGSTNLLLNLRPGSALVDTNGVLIVDAGTATGNPFVLAPTSAGLINYNLLQTGGDTFLVSTVDDAVFDGVLVGRMAQDMWYQSADTYTDYAAARRTEGGATRSSPVGIWAQLYGSQERYGNRNVSFTAFGTSLTASERLKTRRRGAQAGIDFGVGGVFVLGITGGYEHAKANSAFGSAFDVEGYNYGAYAQFGGASGLYAGVLAKRDDYDIRLSNGVLIPLVRPDGRSTGVEGELGFRGGTSGMTFDFGGGLSYVRTKLDDFTTGNIAFDSDRTTSVRGRLGGRLGFITGGLAPYVDAKVYHEFKGDTGVTIGSGSQFDTINGRGRGTWARLAAGLGGKGPLLSVYGDFGDVKGWGVRGGFRF